MYLDNFYTDMQAKSNKTDSKDSKSVNAKSRDKPLADFELFAC